jgi:UrcA family protein
MATSRRIALRMLPVAVALLADSCIDLGSVAYATPEPHAVRVSVADLDLTTHAGAVTAYRRIRNAARSVCGTVDRIFPEERAAWDRCVDEAVGTAIARLGAARLTEYHLAQSRHPLLIRPGVSGPQSAFAGQ